MTSNGLWVFGYGSLIWNPGFQFTNLKYGTIRGYSRKFWQGNITHRGTPEQPGRVATLVEDKEGIVWGVAYEVYNSDALQYLDQRECHLGGYTTALSMFHPSNGTDQFPILLYMATAGNEFWLGHAPEQEIADQIVKSAGKSGHNVEYLLRLAEMSREIAPEVQDYHLFTLERLVRKLVDKFSLPLNKLMGPEPARLTPVQFDDDQPISRISTVQFASSLTSSKSRCVSI